MTLNTLRRTTVLATLLSLTAVTAAAKDSGCSASSVAATWAYTVNGSIVGVGPVASVGSFTTDSSGKLSGSQTRSLNGDIAVETLTGTTTVNADCSGTANIEVFESGILVRTSTFAVIYDQNSTDLRAMFTSVVLPDGTSLGPILTVEGKRLNSTK